MEDAGPASEQRDEAVGPGPVGSRASIVDAFEELVRRRGQELALWSRGEDLRWSFDQLAREVDRWQQHLRHLPAEPVAVATGNVAAFPALFLALRRLGLPVVTVDGSAEPCARVELCRRLGVPRLLHRDPTAEPVEGDVVLREVVEATPAQVPRGTALVKLTSGSTGEPTGICLGEEALLAGIHQIAEGMSLSPRDRILVAIPLSHSYGFDNGVLSLAVLGTPLVLEPGFYPARLLQALGEGEITFLPTVPPLVRSLGEACWPAGLPLRTVICAGGPLPGEFAQRFRERSGRPVHQFYGSTETGGITFERRPEEAAAEGTVGHPLPGVQVELGAEGQVKVRSRANFGGVLGRHRRLTPRTVSIGDLAAWTPEGRLRITGRTASFLKVGGRKISVQALESALREVRGVDDAAVVGVADAVRGDRVVAFLVTDDDAPDLSLLPRRIAPREVRLVDTLPYTSRGKIDRHRLSEMAREPG